MTRINMARLALVASAALGLQGCIAAAIPLVAAGGVIGASADGASGQPSERVAPAQAQITAPTNPIVRVNEPAPSSAALDAIDAEPAIAGIADAGAGPMAEADMPDVAPISGQASLPDEPSAQLAAAPAGPIAPPPPASATIPPFAARTIGAPDPAAITMLVSYANQRQFQFEPGRTRPSALLQSRTTLEPARQPCNGIAPTVLIDLDPEGGVFDPDSASRPPAGLGSALAQLRSQGVAVVWIADTPATREADVRLALVQTTLDLAGNDRLLLMRSPDDRKQVRREELAETSCLIAIAGDTRADFDELYDYLLHPDAAITLEPIIGNGWFLIPQPLIPEGAEQ